MRGRELAGRYTLVEALGPAGRTWLARDTVLHRDVAVTRLPLPAGPPEARDRALADARAAGVITHPALVTVHDIHTEPGEAWLVADFVRGRSLDRIVRAAGPVAPAHAAGIGLRLLDALAAVHARGRAHRAVDPAGVLVADTGDVVLAGLGLVPGDGRPGEDLRALGATLLFAVEGRGPETGPPRPGPLAHVIGSLLYGPHDVAAIRAALAAAAAAPAPVTAAATAAGAVDTGPATRPSTIGARRVWPVVVTVAAALAGTAVAGVVLLRPGPAAAPSATSAAGSAAASASAASPGPAGSGPADPCALVAPGGRPSPERAGSCSVTVGGAKVTIKTHPDAATARTVLAAIRRRQASQAGEFAVERAVTSRLRDVPGLGDEGFAQDSSVGLLPAATSTVWLRVGTWTAQIEVREDRDRVTPGMRTAALRAARTVAAGLTGASS